MSDTILERSYGKASVVVTAKPDYEGGYTMQDYGRFTSWHKADPSRPLYSRRDDTIRLPGSDIWRDRKGRIATEPEDDRGYREYQFIQIEDWYGETLRLAFAAADRVEGYERGDWCMLTLIGRAYLAEREIGSAILGGVESDGGADYLLQMAREQAHEAIADAKHWQAVVAS